MDEILVVAEHRRGTLRDVTFEALALARRLAGENGLSVTAAVLGNRDAAETLRRSADEVLLVDDEELEEYDCESWLPTLDTMLKEREPALTLLGHSATGMDLAPALAARFGLPLVSDVLDVCMDRSGIRLRRQLYGGKIDAELTMKKARGNLVTLRPGCFPADPGTGQAGALTPIARLPVPERRRRRLLGYVEAELEDVDIGAARILVAVGRGLGSPENLPQVQAFADAIGATLACSRPVADKGWLTKSRQVGTSGRVVRPSLYIALGISGAYQHVAGMRSAGTIIAVNSDPRAPIFDVAHYGVVADMLEVLPLLRQRFQG